MQEYLDVGKIVNTHGVKGEMKVIPLTNTPDRFNDLKWIYIEEKGELKKYTIQNTKYHKNFVLVKFKEINDMDAAEKLKEHYIKIDRQDAVELPDDTYFICDIIDCEVIEENGNKLGVLKDVISTGSNDVYVVKNKDNREILVPALKSVVKNISLADRTITVKLPEGLIEDEI